MNAHDFEFTRIDGGTLRLADYAGRALLVVNTASECGYTPQYAGLQQLSDRFGESGLVVIGVPSNDFGAQEPGSEGEIQNFCTSRYDVSFLLTSKQKVAGSDAHPFYGWLVGQLGDIGAPQWNFHKYLVGPDGELAGLWASATDPQDPELVESIEQILSEIK